MNKDAIVKNNQIFSMTVKRVTLDDMILMFCRALADGNKAISLSADWPKGYYRQGIALAGLKVCLSYLSRNTRLFVV